MIVRTHAHNTEATEVTDVVQILHQYAIPKIKRNKSTIKNNSELETCLTDQSFFWRTAVEKVKKTEADLDCTNALQFFNDNLIDIMQKYNLLAFAETTPKIG